MERQLLIAMRQLLSLEKYLGLYGKYTPESDITAGYKEISANFDSGVCAMFTHNLGSYGSHVTAFGGTEGFTANPLPTADNGKYINYGGALTGLCMFDTCENQEAAWKWITFMCDHYATASGISPSDSFQPILPAMKMNG